MGKSRGRGATFVGVTSSIAQRLAIGQRSSEDFPVNGAGQGVREQYAR